jgi:alkylhydroperoxidase family enzyme
MPLDQEMQARIAARHEDVLGQPPRLPPVDRHAVADAVTATTDQLRRGVSGATGELPAMPLEAIPEIMFTLCRFPELWQSMMDVTVQIQGPNSVLSMRDRKLAILRTGWLCQAPYEFGEHVDQAKRFGFSSEEIDRIVVGSAAPDWNEHERAILRSVEELHDNAMVTDETWDQLARRLDDHQRFELLILVGQFTATAYFQNSLRLRLEDRNAGLAAR